MEIKKSSNKEKIECLVDHLKAVGRDDECFNSVGKYNGEPYDCDETIKKILNVKFEDTEKRISNLFDDSVSCVMEELKNNGFYKNEIYLAEVLEHTKISWKFWMYFGRKSRLIDIETKKTVAEKLNYESCKNSQYFTEKPSTTTSELIPVSGEDLDVVSSTSNYVTTISESEEQDNSDEVTEHYTSTIFASTDSIKTFESGSGDGDDESYPDDY